MRTAAWLLGGLLAVAGLACGGAESGDVTDGIAGDVGDVADVPADGVAGDLPGDLAPDVPVDAPPKVPAIEVLPAKIEFLDGIVGQAQQVEVTIRSVGTAELVVTEIQITVDSSPDFSLDTSPLPGGEAPSGSRPLAIVPGDSARFVVIFTPSEISPLDGSGHPIPDTGEVRVFTNMQPGSHGIPVTAVVTGDGCPHPVIVVEEGDQVPLPTMVHLHGEQSVAGSGTILSYAWTVTQPVENARELKPNATFAQPTHEVAVAGEYTYCLDVCDTDGCSSAPQCLSTACKKVAAVGAAGIRIELTWTTPGDADPFDTGDGRGADLDLHFAHPYATGPDLDGDGAPDGWFDIPWDVFWYNKTPEWGSVNPNVPDNPSMDRDDADGAGPEVVSLRVPESSMVYRVGVHYWDDHGFGPSWARLKIYVAEQLAFDRDLEALGQEMVRCDLWEAATITWPQGVVAAVQNIDGGLKITPDYMNPAFVVVGGNSCGP